MEQRPKFQAPTSKLQRKPENQAPKCAPCRVWSLKFGVSLVFGVCMLELFARPHSAAFVEEPYFLFPAIRYSRTHGTEVYPAHRLSISLPFGSPLRCRGPSPPVSPRRNRCPWRGEQNANQSGAGNLSQHS